jgi:hypothetical protein
MTQTTVVTEKFTGEVRLREDKLQNTLEIVIPKGLSHKDLTKVSLGELLSRFRPSGCGSCLSGQDLIIRERFEKVLPIDITAIKTH